MSKYLDAWRESYALYLVTIACMKSQGIIPIKPILRIKCFLYELKGD